MPIPAWEPPCPKERDEYGAMREAARDLERLAPVRAPSMVTSKTGDARIHRNQDDVSRNHPKINAWELPSIESISQTDFAR